MKANNVSKKIFLIFMIGLAVAGVLLVTLSLLKPHKTGIVIKVGKISNAGYHSGVGKHSARNDRYSADIKVQVKGSTETETVYIRTRKAENIPAVGDEITFANSLLTGNTLYPQMGAVYTGIFILVLDLLLFIVFRRVTDNLP